MGADTAADLANIEVCCVCMGGKDHITILINDSVVGICENITKQLCDGLNVCVL